MCQHSQQISFCKYSDSSVTAGFEQNPLEIILISELTISISDNESCNKCMIQLHFFNHVSWFMQSSSPSPYPRSSFSSSSYLCVRLLPAELRFVLLERTRLVALLPMLENFGGTGCERLDSDGVETLELEFAKRLTLDPGREDNLLEILFRSDRVGVRRWKK